MTSWQPVTLSEYLLEWGKLLAIAIDRLWQALPYLIMIFTTFYLMADGELGTGLLLALSGMLMLLPRKED